MKLLFVNIAYPKECYNELWNNSGGLLQPSINVFEWAVIEGLEQNHVDYTLCCAPALPAWPRYRNLFTPHGTMSVGERQRGHYISYCDLPAVKQKSIERAIYYYAKKWCDENHNEKQLIALTYTQQVDKVAPLVKLKKIYPHLLIASIVTDLAEDAFEFKANRSILKKIQWIIELRLEHQLFKNIDKYILLSKHMTERIPEAIGKNIVIECLASFTSKDMPRVPKHNKYKTLVYTGVLQEYAGIRLLLDAFCITTNPKFRLVVCGSGPDSDYVKLLSKKDSRIDYRGNILREEAVQFQQEATLLINPRLPNGGITKFSFPSKTVEYMTSGTPMIGYHLEGIPGEYYDYMITPKDYSVEELAATISSSLMMPQKELDSLAEKAFQFVISEKNAENQIKRMIEFLAN